MSNAPGLAANLLGVGASGYQRENQKMIVRFVYSKEDGRSVQVHGQTYDVEIPGDALTYGSLRKAEGSFLRWFEANFSNEKMIQWSATYPGGKASEYRAYLPCG
jgi:hypothetical protein